jgi:Ssp1 endopeptidase immunity protein Rap1a
MRRTLLAAVLTVAGGGQTWADGFGFQSGEQLLANCQSNKPQETWSCRNYVSGAVDTIQLTQRLTLACMFIPPEGLTEQQAVGVVLDYLKAHPDELWMSGARNVIAAMASEYPCSR